MTLALWLSDTIDGERTWQEFRRDGKRSLEKSIENIDGEYRGGSGE